MKVDVGGGYEKREGYINLDINPHKHCDVCGDALQMPFKSGSLDEVCCHAFVDHLCGPYFGDKSVLTFLKEVFRVLKEGGVIDVEVGDLEATCLCILEGDLSHLQNLYGAQRNEWDYHKWGYTKRSLAELLQNAGFRNVEILKPTSSHATRWKMMRVTGTKPLSPREQAINNLKDFKWAMDTAMVPFVLQDGTLLGAYRDGDFRPDDLDDCDVAVLHQNFDRISCALPMLFERGFFLRKIFEHEGIIQNISIERDGNHIDVARVHIVGDTAYNIGRRRSGLFCYKFPAKHLEKFDQLFFIGEFWNIPWDVKKYLAIRYVDWKTPVARKDYDYTDEAQNPCISKEWKECELCKAIAT